MTSSAFARPGAFVRFALALVLAMLAAACGSGAVSGPTPVNDPNRITILPATAILYSGMATTFTINGGTGSYFLSSSNQAVVQVSGSLTGSGHTITVIPANVVEETTVTLTVRDSATAPLATATLTVRPGTVANDIVIIPTETQGGSCAPAVCSGGDALVFATISQGGNPLPARGVRLDVVSGDFRFITSRPGLPEILETSTVVVTDQAGGVHARIRVLPGAPNQTGVLQVTDLGTNAFRRATFIIAQATGSSPGFFTVPAEVTFTGPNTLSCASGARADVNIFGGLPPYTIGNGGSAFGVSQTVVTASGGSFYIVANGTCAEDVPIAVVDSAGRTTIVNVSNVRGTFAIPDLVVSPEEVTLTDCSSTASVSVAGGTGTFTVSTGSGALFVGSNQNQRLINISRAPGTLATTPLSVGVASGDKTATITVHLAGDALNTRCDGAQNIRLTPSTVTLASCGPVTVAITGGAPNHHVRSDNSSIRVTPITVVPPNNTFTVERTPGSASFDMGTVFVTDNNGTGLVRTLPVTGTGTGAGSGTGACPPP